MFQVTNIKSPTAKDECIELLENKNDVGNEAKIKALELEITQMSDKLQKEHSEWDSERIQWAQEKEKVLSYQRQLQLNYVQMYRRTRTLESQLQNLSLEVDSNAKNRTKVASLNAIQL